MFDMNELMNFLVFVIDCVSVLSRVWCAAL